MRSEIGYSRWLSCAAGLVIAGACHAAFGPMPGIPATHGGSATHPRWMRARGASEAQFAGVQVTSLADRLEVRVAADRPSHALVRRASGVRGSRFCITADLPGHLPGNGRRTADLGEGVASVRWSNFRPHPATVRIAVSTTQSLPFHVDESPDGRSTTLVIDRGVDRPSQGGLRQADASPTTPARTRLARAVPPPRAFTLAALPATRKSRPSPPKASQKAAPKAEPTVTDHVEFVTAPRKVRLDFVDADVQEVFRALAAQTQSNIIVSPDVKGNVTASLRDMTVDEALDAVSRTVGVAYQKVDETYYVAPQSKLNDMFAPAPVTQTYAVHAADPAELAAVIKAAIPALIEATPAGKYLIVVKGPGGAVEKAMALLPTLDVNSQPPAPEAPRIVTRIRELHHLDPTSTVSKLSDLFAAGDGKTTLLKVTEAPLLSLPVAKSAGGGGASAGGASGGSDSSGGGGSGDTGTTVSSGVILLTGPADIVERAMQVLDQLDVAPRQVEIRARVLDISTSEDAQRGIRWDWSNTFNFTELGPASSTTGGATGGATGGTAGSTNTFFHDPALHVGAIVRSSPITLQAQIAQAIQTGQARVLAEPSLRVIEGRTARIFIGDSLRVLISRDVTPTGTTIVTDEFHPGITLVVSARTTPGGDITLDVRPTVSVLTSLTAQGTDIPLPRISERSAQTTIRLHDGDTMVIGGLLQDQDVRNLSKVPGLGDLPFFGNLFRFRSITKRHSEVVIFLTTRLIPS